jgi:mannose-1-phosphate guanylyltransferase
MIENNFVVIMAGGVGTRFWPFSRNNYPKQFHDVLGTGQTLLQQTASRFEGICLPENIFVATNAEYYDLVKAQLPYLIDQQILLEPCRRNTAPCIAYACYKITSNNPNANIIVAPADHIILKEEAFKERILTALEVAQNNDVLVTLGIKPSRPDTGYGYIQFEEGNNEAKKVRQFTEKPVAALAQQFVESGEYVWNAGIFVWSGKSICNVFEKYLPDMAHFFSGLEDSYFGDTEQSVINMYYQDMESISIDFGIMEKADNVHVILSEFGWSDLGTWRSLYEVSDKDEAQNTIDGQVLVYDSTNCIIKTPKDKLVVVQGLDGYIVAENDGVLMICKLDEEQRVKNFVADAGQIGSQFI